MLTIDGSRGEGGGQVLRTSLALSLITRTPFRIENIRARRKKPGLLRQHLTAVNAAAEVGDAIVEGAHAGSGALTFTPRALRAGDYSFDIGTAGSTMLVLQTIVLPLVLAGAASTVTVQGGTHNPAAPPFDFMTLSFLPLLRRLGAQVELSLERPGFYPAGGGKVVALIEPAARLGALQLETRGDVVRRTARAVVANLPLDVARRELDVVARELAWPPECLDAQPLRDAIGPGNALSIIVESEQVTEVFTGFGERRVRAEDVALGAAAEARKYLESGAAVGEHLADQLLLPLAIGDGGTFVTMPLSGHSLTNVETIRAFVARNITTEELPAGNVRVSVR